MAGAAVYKQRKNEESDLSRFSRGANLTAWSLKKTRERETQESQEPKNLKETAKDKVQMHAVSLTFKCEKHLKNKEPQCKIKGDWIPMVCWCGRWLGELVLAVCFATAALLPYSRAVLITTSTRLALGGLSRTC